MSDVPARASRPERCSSVVAISCGERCSCSSSQSRRPRSTLPDRVAITRPSSGVNPMVVSTLRPSTTAARDAPAPRWHVTMRSPRSGRPTQFSGPAGAVRVGQAMESVAADAVLLPPLARDRVRRRRRRHGGVEGGVEAGDAGTAGRTAVTASSAARDLGWWSGARSIEAGQPLPHRGVDDHRAGEVAAAVDDAVTDGIGTRPVDAMACSSSVVSTPDGPAGRSALCSRTSTSSSRRSFRLEEPALTTSTRTHYSPRGSVGQVHPEIAGSSSPCSRV